MTYKNCCLCFSLSASSTTATHNIWAMVICTSHFLSAFLSFSSGRCAGALLVQTSTSQFWWIYNSWAMVICTAPPTMLLIAENKIIRVTGRHSQFCALPDEDSGV